MRDHDRDSPIDAEIQRLIEKREFTEAFEQSYIAFKGEIKTRCIRALRSYVDDPVAEGEDLAQKIFTEFFRLLPTHYQPNLAKVRTFLNHITRRRIQDRLKQIKYTISYELVSGKSEDREPHSPNLEMVFLDQEKVEILKRAMVNKLTPLEMSIFIDYYIEGYSIVDIAQRKGKNMANIRTRLHQARVKLKKELEGDR